MSTILTNHPLIAILRGLVPDRAEAVGELLYQAGWRVIEVPLNSPDALRSIALLRARLPQDCLVGAGTVLSTQAVDEVADAGGQIIVSPNTDAQVIRHSKAQQLLSVPGVMTPSEAFSALDAGADALKYFPCEALSPAAINAQRAVLPKEALILAVGGVNQDNMANYLAVGVGGFGFGSAVFTPALSDDAIDERARAIQHTWHKLTR